jgi:hypothetical protein
MKIFKRILGLFIIVFLIALFSLYTYLPGIVAKKIEKTTQVPVSIRSLGISLNEIEVNQFLMSNISGSILPIALNIDEVSIETPVTQFLKNETNINKIVCDNFFIGLEFNSKSDYRGNWTVIVNNMNQDSSSKSPSEKVINIRKLILNNVDIHLVYKDKPKQIQKLKINRIELDNLSTAGDFPIKQLSKIIIQQTLKQIFSIKNLGNMLKDLLNPAPIFKNPLSPFFSMDDSLEESLKL